MKYKHLADVAANFPSNRMAGVRRLPPTARSPAEKRRLFPKIGGEVNGTARGRRRVDELTNSLKDRGDRLVMSGELLLYARLELSPARLRGLPRHLPTEAPSRSQDDLPLPPRDRRTPIPSTRSNPRVQ